ncbi:Prophage tail length tape measure protein [Neorhizobium galegae bv. officinalis bv. officinalis str. HAMBI 1141]|uniref:Prophage tail length tape measure protein n=1 Tax=Neorhizobium galegae bv. officinalis bv. officinalis str. HAMBI 1141 TaxID=1028801 RepID=A0A068T5D7_NEOGA|nr:phage tail length tape measure family protein [Neorhizobium galegae]CDN52540.1 Prophage tail length tape measure protein [Neorhizobium galegae bv. officinalis bv. officinalis str. HAMBI 1141]
MAAEQRVVELVVDASGAVAGARLAGQAYDHMGDRAQAAMQKAQSAFDRQQQVYERQLPRSIDQVGDAYDRLRGRIDPVFNSQLRAEREMTQSLAVINRAVMLGVTTEQEATATIMRLKRQQIEEINRVRDAQVQANNALRMQGANDNRRGGGLDAANIGYQFQDIAVTAAMGMSPLMIGLQQGTQLASVVSTMERPVRGLATAFMSLISPVSLVTIGLTAGVAALIQYFSTSSEGSGKMSADLRAQAELIASVANKWGDATPMLKAYADQLERAADAANRLKAADVVAKEQYKPVEDVLSGINPQYIAARRALQGLGEDADPLFRKVTGSFADLQSKIMNGTATIENLTTVQNALNEAYEKTGLPVIARLIKAYDELLPRLREVAKTAADIRKEGVTSIYPSPGSYDGVPRSADGPIQGEEFQLPERGPTPQSRPLRELDPAFNPYDQINKSGDERLRQLKQEADLLGLTGAAAAALRFEQEQLNAAYAQNLELSPDQLTAIRDQAAAYGQLTEQMARARMQADVKFDIDQLGRSPIDQQIASSQRSAGLPVDLNGDYAGQVRQLERVKELRSDVKGFFSDFKEGLLSGDSIGEALRNSIINALSKQADRLWDSVFSGLASVMFPASGGNQGSGLSAAGSVAGALFSGRGANDNRAPVTPVTRAALPDVGAVSDMSGFRNAIASIESAGSGGYSALGPITKNGDRAYGRYQVMGNNIGPWSEAALGQRLSASDFLANPSLQDKVFDHRFGGYVNKYGPSGAAQAWFGGPGSVGKGGNVTDMLGTSGTEYVNKFTNALGGASKNVDTFGGGLGKLGQSLSASAFPAAPAAPSGGGGGGLFGWLGGLFGGGGLNSALSASPQFAKAWSLGGIGLYDRGGFTGHGGVNDPAGVVHRGEVVWSQADVARAGGVGVVEGMRLGLQGYADGGVGGNRPTVAPIRQAAAPAAANTNLRFEHVHSFDGDGNIKTITRTIVREEAPDISRQVGADQLRRERIDQERGGFGAIQSNYTKRKG